MKEGIKWLEDMGMVMWICYMRPENLPENYVTQEDKEDTPFKHNANKKCTAGSMKIV